MSNFYFTQHKCAFIHIPKTAGLSIRESGILGPRSSAYFGVMPPSYKFAFSFVRNPLNRLVSAYRMFSEGRSFLNGQRFTGDLNSFLDIVTNENIDFHVKGKRPINVNIRHHTLPMTHPFNCLDKADYIGRFENLKNDWSEICKKIGIRPVALPHRNKSSKPKIIIPTDTIKRIKEYYHEDYKEFNYE